MLYTFSDNIYIKLTLHNSNIFSMANTIFCIYSNCLLMMTSYSVRNMYRIYHWKKIKKKSVSCWSLLLKYIMMHGPENVKSDSL